jgi:toxin YoeB
LVAWTLRFERHARKDALRLKAAGLKSKADAILDNIQEDPYYVPPPFEKLIGDLAGLFSRRINRQHRIVYEVLPATNEVVVHMMYAHYRD